MCCQVTENCTVVKGGVQYFPPTWSKFSYMVYAFKFFTGSFNFGIHGYYCKGELSMLG